MFGTIYEYTRVNKKLLNEINYLYLDNEKIFIDIPIYLDHCTPLEIIADLVNEETGYSWRLAIGYYRRLD